jgi:hypothetical protein
MGLFASTGLGTEIMSNPQILIDEEIREMTDNEVKNYLQVIDDYEPVSSVE